MGTFGLYCCQALHSDQQYLGYLIFASFGKTLTGWQKTDDTLETHFIRNVFCFIHYQRELYIWGYTTKQEGRAKN